MTAIHEPMLTLKPCLIIFDWDGTLLNSEHVIINTHQKARLSLGLSQFDGSTLKTLLGLSKDAVCQLATAGTCTSPEAYYKAFCQAYHTQKTHVTTFPETHAILDTLKKCNITMALATNKASIYAGKELLETKLLHYFQQCEYADLAQPKPSPTMLNNILQQQNINTSQAIMIGDQLPDIQAAKHANIRSITLYQKERPNWKNTCQYDTKLLTHTELLHWTQQLLPSAAV